MLQGNVALVQFDLYITNYFTNVNDNYYFHSSSTQIENSNVTQEATEVKKTLPDKYSDVSDSTKKTKEEKNQQQKRENCTNIVIAKESDIETLNVSDKKNETLGKQLETNPPLAAVGRINLKTEQTKQSDQSPETIVQNLPSVDNLDSLSDSSSIPVLEEKEEENFIQIKKKKTILHKILKKKIAVKVWQHNLCKNFIS